MKYYIFDFDGVIANSFQIASEEINRIREERFPTLPAVKSPSDMVTLYPGPLKTSLRRFGLTDRESKEFFDLHSAAMARRSHEVTPFEDVLSTIINRVAGRFGIVTSAYSVAVENILSKCASYSKSLVNEIMGRELNMSKSSKIDIILNKHGVERHDVLHFGDLVSDLIYSREVNVPFCAVGWGYHPISYIRAFDPDHFVETCTGLDTILSS